MRVAFDLLAVIAIAPALFVAGCLFDPTVPPGTTIACATTADCPGGLSCSPDGRCANGDPPDVVNAEVSPLFVNDATVVTARVTFATRDASAWVAGGNGTRVDLVRVRLRGRPEA